MDDDEGKQLIGSPVRARYSVSFQEHFTEVTPLLGADDTVSPVASPLLEENESCFIDDNDTQTKDPQQKRLVTPTCPPSYGAVDEKDRRRIKSYSFSDATPDYQSTNNKKSTTMVLCSHGKELGKCCADLENGLSSSFSRNSGETEHCHVSSYTPVDRAARKRLITASILCLIFMIGEVVGGYLAGSLAIMTDAAHLLTDFASFMISLFSLWVAARPATKRMSFGWYRAEVMGALTSVLLIWVVTGILVYMAVERIISKTYEIEATIMLITSGVGVCVNIIMGVVLFCQGGSHGHSHGGMSHSHLSNNNDGSAKDNINVRAAFIHVIGDFLQSIGVFVAALIIYFKPEWGITDPICTFLFSIVVLVTTITILRDVLTVLMEGIPRGIDFNDVQKTFISIKGVVKVHNLRIWSLSMDKVALAAHIAIDPESDPKEILKESSRVIREKYNFLEMTLQIEDYIEEMQDCSQCRCPED